METPLTARIQPGREPLDLRGYERAGGYQAVRKALLTMSPKEVRDVVEASGLRGRGGAGFPTAKKWNYMPPSDASRQPRYFAVNADEMEPGTFKDRYLLEGDPHQVIEGAIVAAYATEASVAYIFARWEYTLAARRLHQALAEARAAGYLGSRILGSDASIELHLHVSHGRYMCGEEEGLLDALEGKRPIPRPRPPHPTTCGFWGRPTAVNNTETVCNLPHIVTRGAEWFRGLGRSTDSGTKLYGASGHVRRPGLWELPIGTPAREILEEHAGGMAEGFRFRGLLPGGASTEFLLDEHLDVPMDFDSVPKVGSRLGTGALVVLDDRTCPVGMVRNLQHFFARESCGWCTPCREGLPWAARVLDAIEEGRGRPEDLDVLEHLTWFLGPGHTFCMLAPGAMEPLQSALKCFRADFDRHIREQCCPWK